MKAKDFPDPFEALANLAINRDAATKEELSVSLSKHGHDVPKFIQSVHAIVQRNLESKSEMRRVEERAPQSPNMRRIIHDTTSRRWKHPSVAMFAGRGDPIGLMQHRASEVALNAMQEGWAGPPFDPFALAELLHISVVPNSEVLDARTIPLRSGKVQIEYNPNRPRARIRYSLAHEIAHTFFPDCAQHVRNRAARQDFGRDEWELEMLCNLGAAELLMPTGSLADLRGQLVTIHDVLELRKRFEVSTESVMLRLMKITEQPITMFVASRRSVDSPYSIDYSIGSRTSLLSLTDNLVLPNSSAVGTCTAMGYKALADETWSDVGSVHVECVGVSPYGDSVYPRVIGLVHLLNSQQSGPSTIRIVTGDATEPHGVGRRILAHVVNDATPNWGAGFGRVVQTRWPDVQKRFQAWWATGARKRLGATFFSDADAELQVCQMVCQRGYGPSTSPRLRYAALRDCLSNLRDRALELDATVHMPRIGTGEAGGSWPLVFALLDEVLCAARVSVTIYDLPKSRKAGSVQSDLFDRARRST